MSSQGTTSLSNDLKGIPLGVSGFHFSDLYAPVRLKDLNDEFWKFAETANKGLKDRFFNPAPDRTPPQESELLIEVAKVFGDFIAKLFQVSNHASSLRKATLDSQPIFRFKKDFLNIRVFKRFTESPCDAETYQKLEETVNRLLANEPPKGGDPELAFSEITLFLADVEKKLKTAPLEPNEQVRVQNLCSHFPAGSVAERISTALTALEEWCVQTYVDKVRRKKIANWVSFVRPAKLDFENLVALETPDSQLPEKKQGPDHDLRFRDGFKLTDNRMTPKQVLREIDYCIYCHQREKDSCSHGFPEKADPKAKSATIEYKKNPLGIPLTGCPLDEKISEFQWLRKHGDVIASLAMIMLDNPMCPGTGHRICNDCMKGCIFQKQEPVNIPQNETAVLTDVLNMPYGFEIYSLLTRFNPLSRRRPYALPYNGVDVMVVGLGPAGYTLSHYLANEGFGVVGVDALKLEPIDPFLTGKGKPFPKPIANFSELKKELDERILTGFGGVSEYGITVRWDKNFLNVIYMSLLRRPNLKFYGGVRFGGTINLEDAWALGFQHVALATGAGKPTIIDMKNNLIRGIRKASDFLMGLQLTGAFKKSSMANLQVKLPAVVIGGGLTAVDTATELLAYYPGQVEKTLDRFEALSREFGEEKVWEMCGPEEKETLVTFLEHGRAVRDERRLAEKERRKPNFISMIRRWGGVTLAYRKRIVDSPAYRLNHEEVAKALEEGIYFAENMTPLEANRDQYGAVESLRFKRGNGQEVTLPAKAVMVAAGTSPNTIYEREYPGSFTFDAKKNFFQSHRVEMGKGGLKLVAAKPGEPGFFLSYEKEGKVVSYYGDNHPVYAGNVVKAMASAKHGFEEVRKLFPTEIENAETGRVPGKKFDDLVTNLDSKLVPKVVKVNRLTPTIVEVIVKGHFVANKFEPGQFYRLQNYETFSPTVDGAKLQMEGLALTGAYVDKEKDLLSMIVLEMGGSTRLVAALKPGDPVVVMGPTGTPSEAPGGETVMLVGGGLGNAVLLSIGEALRKNGSKVIYFAGYRRGSDLFYPEKVEAVTDQVIWAVDAGDPIPARRPDDISFVGNILQAMLGYAKGELSGGKPKFPFQKIDRIICIGSDRMMAAVAQARHGVLKPFLNPKHIGIGSINSPMQCMMKEVCAQCLQRHVDPKTGKEYFVFSCNVQDQELDLVDWNNLNERLKSNNLAEKMGARYLDILFEKSKLERV